MKRTGKIFDDPLSDDPIFWAMIIAMIFVAWGTSTDGDIVLRLFVTAFVVAGIPSTIRQEIRRHRANASADSSSEKSSL